MSLTAWNQFQAEKTRFLPRTSHLLPAGDMDGEIITTLPHWGGHAFVNVSHNAPLHVLSFLRLCPTLFYSNQRAENNNHYLKCYKYSNF